ncbi:MAG: DUF1786 domain-containing protein [Chloroflexi bacterium]|nr:DUF1786 domain-containing protein [Chloroflexota bacterium]
MRILTVDVGTGTQDIYLYDSRIDLENGFKLVVPSPTMMVHKRLKEATHKGEAIALTGVTMGGGPSHWAARDHAKAGFPVYATAEAARTFDDDLSKVEADGIKVISEDEIASLPDSVTRLELRDFDFSAIGRSFNEFGVSLDELDAVAVAVFDHGAAPPDVSDRQFRFDYLDEHIKAKNRLSAFAFKANNVPAIMTRLQAVVDSASDVDAPLVVMDTAPAAVLGATLDPEVKSRSRALIANVGNFHTLSFRLGPKGIEGVFEHHTGLIDLPKLEGLLKALADGSLEHEDVFGDHGHGALIYEDKPLTLGEGDFDVVVTGPRRSMFHLTEDRRQKTQSPSPVPRPPSRLRPYFPAPFGDMMIAGCFGLLAAVADVLPDLSDPIRESLAGDGGSGTPPWEIA